MQSNLEILTDINPKDYFPDAKHIIIYAFTIGDRHYFRFDDPLNTPYERALKTIVYYKELDMNCDAAILKAHTEAFDNSLKQTTITIDTLVELKKLNDQLKARLELPKEPDLMYKLASVVFFDQYESPYNYEFKYGQNKIKHWKKEVSLDSFFLSTPLKTLIPYLAHAGENLIMYSEMIQTTTTKHLEKLSEMLSEEQREVLKSKFIF